MLGLILGPDAFDAGIRLYLRRYRNGNANTDQFFRCFEEASGMSLAAFRRKWLERPGYPKVSARTHHDPVSRTFTVTLRQDAVEGEEPFPVPVDVASVDHQGRDMEGTTKTLVLAHREQTFRFSDLPSPPAFASLNRNASFYGTFTEENADEETSAFQALKDPNSYNHVEAFRKLTDRQRVLQITAPGCAVSEAWLALYWRLLNDPTLAPACKASMLRIDEQPLDRRYAAWFPELVRARDALMAAFNSRYADQLVARFQDLQKSVNSEASLQDGIQKRLLSTLLIELMAVADTPEIHGMFLIFFRRAATATERYEALTALNRSSWPGRLNLLEETYALWRRDVTGYANYLKVIASGPHPDLWTLVEREKARPGFDLTHPTLSRALLVTMAQNTRRVWTEEGIDRVCRHVIELSWINAGIARRLLNTFQHVPRLKPEWRRRVCRALENIVENVPEKESPSIHGQAAVYLEACRRLSGSGS